MHVPKMKWLKSVEGWVQLNTNEVSCGNLEKVGGGGIIRNAQGKFLESNWDHNKRGCKVLDSKGWTAFGYTQLGLKASNGLKIEIKLHAEVVVELVNSNSSDNKTLIDVFVWLLLN